MKRFAILLLAAVVGLTGCVKMTVKTDVKNDASGVMTMDYGVKTEALETIKGFMESAADQGAGGEEIEQAQEAFDQIDELFDDKKMAETMKEMGIEVKSATKAEKDGWKTMAVVGGVKDINVWLAKAAKKQQDELDEMGMDIPIDPTKAMPTFYKTDKQGVGKVVLIPALADLFGGEMPFDLEELEELGDEELDMIESQLDMMKTMLSVDDMKAEMILNLPGKILSTTGCKKSGDNGVKFTFAGGDINLDGMKNLFGFKNGVSATFEIPEGCKIQFKDATAKKGEQKTGAGEQKAEEKKGGLKIGGGK